MFKANNKISEATIKLILARDVKFTLK